MMPPLAFSEVRDKILFSVILTVRRLEDPTDNPPTSFFTYNEVAGVMMTPIDDQFLESQEGLDALASNLPEQAQRQDALYAFFMAAMFDGSIPGDEFVFLLALDSVRIEMWAAPLSRRRFGNPLLGKWERRDVIDPSLSVLVSPLRAFLNRDTVDGTTSHVHTNE